MGDRRNVFEEGGGSEVEGLSASKTRCQKQLYRRPKGSESRR